MANYLRFGGRSCAFDGIAYAPDGGPRNHLLVQAGPGDGIVVARLDLDALRSCRQTGPLADAYRKPRCYAPIAVQSPPQPPFARPFSRR